MMMMIIQQIEGIHLKVMMEKYFWEVGKSMSMHLYIYTILSSLSFV